MVIYFLDDAKNTVEKNVCVITGDAYLNLGKGINLKISILQNICQATGCKLIRD
jgi:DNA-binding Xre family transcriptional regulator